MPQSKHRPPVEQVVADAVRSLREARGWKQDDLARALHGLGLRWNQSAVGKLERGERRHIGLAEFLLLAAALEVRLADLIGGAEGQIALNDLAAIKADRIREAFNGALIHWASEFDFDVPATRAAGRRHTGQDLATVARAIREIGDAEHAAARRLGIAAADVAVIAQRLWGRSLSAERDHRVAEAGSDARGVKGWTTKKLVAELADALGKEQPQ